MPLSDTGLRNLKPADRTYKRFDGGGLFVQVNPSGSKIWHLKYRFRGKEKLLSFGPYPLISLKDAREKRDQAKRELLDGLDPSEQRKLARLQDEQERGVTFGGIAEEYLEKLRKEGRAEQTMKKQEWLVGFTQADLSHRPVSQIEAPDVLSVLKKVEGNGTYETARRLRTTIGAIFRYAIATGRARYDPTEALKGALIQPQVASRAALIDPQKLGELLLRTENFKGQATTKHALRLLALLAPRPGELRHPPVCRIKKSPEPSGLPWADDGVCRGRKALSGSGPP